MRKYFNLLVVAMFSAGLMLAVGCGGTETEKKEPEKTEKTEEGESSASNTVGDAAEVAKLTPVSLNLPNMT